MPSKFFSLIYNSKCHINSLKARHTFIFPWKWITRLLHVASLCSSQAWAEGFSQDQPSVAKRFVPSQFWWKIFKIMVSDAESQCCHSIINNELGEHLSCHMGWKWSNVCFWYGWHYIMLSIRHIHFLFPPIPR